jgi:hypothetical protein
LNNGPRLRFSPRRNYFAGARSKNYDFAFAGIALAPDVPFKIELPSREALRAALCWKTVASGSVFQITTGNDSVPFYYLNFNGRHVTKQRPHQKTPTHSKHRSTSMDTMDKPPKFEHGTISPNTQVECVTIRVMEDGEPERLQGRIKNISEYSLEDVKCDLSYFDSDGTFLGLDISSFTQLDDIDIGETAPFDMELRIPIEAVRCVFNVHAKRVLQDIGVALKSYVEGKAKPKA